MFGFTIKNSNMKKLNKKILTVLLMLIWIFISVWAFNHINPWVGILLSIGGGWLSANNLFKQIKEKNEKEF